MSRQFDVVANPVAAEAAHWPYLLVLQSDLVSGLASTVVAPLVPRANMVGAGRLNPILVVHGREFWLATHELFAVDRRILRETVASLSEERDVIMTAIDFIFIGFGKNS